MAVKITKLNYVKTSDTLKIFNVIISSAQNSAENIVYFADTNNSIDNDYGNILCGNTIIQNIYRSNKIFYKSNQKTSSGTDTYNYNNIFLHEISSQVNDVIQVNNVFYTYTDKDIYGSYILNEDIYSYISADTGHITPADVHISTLTFNKEDLTISGNIENIRYNKLLEIPGFYSQDYDSGNIIAGNYKLKNHYSGIYNMEHDTNYVLKSCRDYIGIGSFNDTVYLKYKDNINYTKTNLQVDNNSNKYEKIEVLHSLNRKNNIQKHKTNLFSININANLNNAIMASNDQKNNTLNIIKSQIKNIVRTYVNKLKPANTQLFLVKVDEK